MARALELARGTAPCRRFLFCNFKLIAQQSLTTAVISQWNL